MTSSVKFLLAALLAAVIATIGASPAMARTHVRFGFGFGYYAPWPYYPPPPVYYVPPPAYYPPPPVVYYSPPPVVYYSPPVSVTPNTNCRAFNGDATNDQTHAPFYGTACLWPDGKWHIVN